MNVMNLTIIGLIDVLEWENCHHVLGNSGPTFNIPVDQPPMHRAGQSPPIPMAWTYVAPANMGGGVGLSGGDHIPPCAYPRPMPPQFNGQGMNPMGFMLLGGTTRGAWT
ncbi:hypothetical protein LINGRAHAP2_LOCUS30261 [Linum grandiflorum]